MPIDPNGITLEDVIAEKQRRAQGGKAQTQQPQGMTQNPDINALIAKATQPYGVRQNIGDAMSILGGGKATGAGSQDDLSKLYAQEAIKKQFEDPLDQQLKQSLIDQRSKPTFIAGYDESGSPVYHQAPQGKIVQQPAGQTPAYQQKATAQGNLANRQSDVMGQFLNGSDGSNGMIAPEATVGGVKMVNPDAYGQMAKLDKSTKGENTADAGRFALAQEAIQNIQDVKKTLFPDGTPNSFKRDIATGSNLPGIRLPMVGRITPSVTPELPGMNAKEGQDVFRKMGTALSGRQLIQTGVAARPEETQKLVEQFAPGMFSNPDAALEGLNQLEKFYSDFLNISRPQQYGQQQSGPRQVGRFTVEEA